MKRFRWLCCLVALLPLACDSSKKAEAPKQFEPMPKSGPVGAGGAPKVGGAGGGAAAPGGPQALPK